MKPQTLPIAAVVVLALATVSIVRTQPVLATNPPPAAPPRSEFGERVAAIGLIEPRSENISIASHLSGVVEKVFAVVGQNVRAGDPLVKLDTRALDAKHAERRADLATREAEAGTATARARKARAALSDVQSNLRFAESVSDPRSLSAEELSRRRSAVEIAEAELQAAEAGIVSANAAVQAARAALEAVETDIARSTVTAPIDGRVLQVRIRPGEFAPAGPSATPWMLLGDVGALHVRVDIDEHEAWRVRPGAKAVAQIRGNSTLQAPAHFVRFEPFVLPKQSLTGASTERVDTRVLQAVYRIESPAFPVFVGQQMDVFIEAADPKSVVARN